MLPRLIRAVFSTLAARIVSAALSFAVFASVATSLPPASAARVLFFSFAFGFALASLRTFNLIAARLTGSESRTERLRRLRRASRTVGKLSLLAAPAVAVLLVSQGVGLGASLAGMVLAIVCGHDTDLPRAVVGRSPLLPWFTGLGGVLGAGLLWATPQPSEDVAAAAFLLQWAPVAVYTMLAGRRLLRGRSVGKERVVAAKRRAVAGALLLSVFDGAVLNAPFILALPLNAVAAVELALGNRLFIASLALFSLVSSWAVSGDLHRLAQRTGLRTPGLFALLQLVTAVLIGLTYAGLYVLLTQKPVGLQALLVAAAILLAYVLHSTAIRFAVGDSLRRVYGVYGVTLLIFYAVCGFARWGAVSEGISLVSVTSAITLALTLPALVTFSLGALVRNR